MDGITVRLQGGLGNQLYQYAAALAVRAALSVRAALTVRENTPIYFIMFERNEHNHNGHDYANDLFIEGKPHTSLPDLPPHAVYTQDGAFTRWDPETVSKIGPLLFLDGYFQYLPTVIPILPELRISFLGALFRKTGFIMKQMKDTGFVHVRRGDYLLNPTYHWVQPISYYEEGMRIINLKKWLVFSDDVDWCNSQACFKKDGILIMNEPDELRAMCAMICCCGGAVISNSSFSWWAAMLGANEYRGRVVYPELWSETYKPELFPAGWISL